MAYSNVTPPTLPSYDSVANPYYLIQFEYAIGAENWETVRFWFGAAPLTWNGSAVTNAVAFSLFTYGTGSPEWTAWGVMAEAGEMALTPGSTTADTYMRLYTNHDILDGTGAVWLAEGTVTPTEEDKEAEIQIRKKSQLAGIIAAWCAPVRQFPKPTAEPVAWETLWEGELNFEQVDSARVLAKFTIDGDAYTARPMLFSGGDTLRITIDGKQETYTATSVTETFAKAGNEYLDGGGGVDTGENFFMGYFDEFSFGTAYCYAREPGTYKIKIERRVK